MKVPAPLPGIASLIDGYDTFLLDQFGVLHDGAAPYPGVLQCLRKMKGAGKKIVILSNSGKRAAENEKRMVELGFTPQMWDLFISSGEAAWRMFSESLKFKPGMKCFLISRDNDQSAIDGLGLGVVNEAAAADVILLTASEGDRLDLGYYRTLLAAAAKSGVPCICTNPDKVMLTRSGTSFAAGRIAELYEEMGGRVTWIGKPFPAIYEAALKAIGDPLKSRVLCIGDSPEHDIEGGMGAGLAAALVRTGIHADLSVQELLTLLKRQNCVPDFILPSLVWQ